MTEKPTYKQLEQRVKDMKPGDHLCCIYQTEKEHRVLLTPFMRQGLERGEKVLYIVDARTAEEVLNYLRDDGVEVEPYLESGQLVILTVDEAYVQEGIFDPDGMIGFLRDETERTLDEGYSALRVAGEMTWALRGLPGSKRLIEYEAKLNDFFLGSKCLAVCQYDRRSFKPVLLLDVLSTHPITVIGTEVFDNFYYVPAKDFLGPDPEAAKLANWLDNLIERKQAQKALRESNETLLTVLDSIDAGVYVSDLKSYQVLFINKHMQDTFGKDLVGKQCFQVFRDEKQPCGHCTNDRLLGADGQPTGVLIWEGQNPVTKRWYRNYDKAVK